MKAEIELGHGRFRACDLVNFTQCFWMRNSAGALFALKKEKTMLARKVVTRRGRRFRGYYPSAKLGRMVAWESLLERDAILLLEFSPGVVAYREQPAEIHYAFATTTRTYYPDFEVVLANGKRLHVEVKTAAKLSRPEVAAKFTAVAEHYLRIKLDLRFITDEDVRPEPLQTNLRTLSYLVHHIEAGGWLPAHQMMRIIAAEAAILKGVFQQNRRGSDGRLPSRDRQVVGLSGLSG